MIPSLEYLARNVVIENSILENHRNGIKKYTVVGEKKIIDQYCRVIRDKLPWVEKIRTSDIQIFIIADCQLLHVYVPNFYKD